METLTDANGEERKGIEVWDCLTGQMQSVSERDVREAICEMVELNWFLGDVVRFYLATIYDLMLAGF